MACGLCCDGTLFDHVKLGADDDIRPLSQAHVGIISNGGTPAISLPCTAYANRACSIYSERPHICRQFHCRLLRRFKANKISEGRALDVIRKAIALRGNVKQQMRTVFSEDDCNFDNFTARLISRCKDASSAEAKASVSALFQSFAALWLYLNRHFRAEWHR